MALFVWGLFCLVVLQKGIAFSLELVSGEGVDLNGMQAVKDAFFNIRVVFFQFADQFRDLLAFALADSCFRILGEAACTLQEGKGVVAYPRTYIVFMNTVQRTDQFHPFEILAPKFWEHGRHLRTVEHSDQCSLDDVREVVTKGDLVASEFLCLAVSVPRRILAHR